MGPSSRWGRTSWRRRSVWAPGTKDPSTLTISRAYIPTLCTLPSPPIGERHVRRRRTGGGGRQRLGLRVGGPGSGRVDRAVRPPLRRLPPRDRIQRGRSVKGKYTHNTHRGLCVCVSACGLDATIAPHCMNRRPRSLLPDRGGGRRQLVSLPPELLRPPPRAFGPGSVRHGGEVRYDGDRNE